MADDTTQLYQALRNADAAGDVDAAKKIASYIQSKQAEVPHQKSEVAGVPGMDHDAQDGNRNAGTTSPGASLTDKVIGGGEALLTLGTGALGGIAGALAGAGKVLTGGKYGTQQGAQEGEKFGSKVAEALTYQPRTQAGQDIAQGIGHAVEASGIAGLPIGAEMGVAGSLARPAAAQAGNVAGKALATDAYIAKNAAQAAKGAAANVGGAVASKVGSGVANLIGELGTHTGGESIKNAFRAGVNKDATFIDNLRGNVPLTDVLDTAKANLENMRTAKSAEYRNGMQQVSNDQSILGFGDVDKALSESMDVGAYKGQVVNKKAQAKMAEAAQAVENWRSLDPAQYHTPEGFDALKRTVGGILESIPFEQKTARKAVGNVYHSIRDTVAKQAPVYDDVMKGYQQAAEQITEIERALSLGNKAAADTAMRKLQSLTRNNANTNYGNRLDLARQMAEQGGTDIMPALSGQALSAMAPRGLGKLAATASAGASILHPGLAVTLPFQSPRLMGEAAYATGRAVSGIASRLGVGAEQAAARRGIPTAAVAPELSLVEESPFPPRVQPTPEPQYNGLLQLADDTDPAYAITGQERPGMTSPAMVPDTQRLATSHDVPTIEFPLRQEVMQQPEISSAIDAFRLEDARLTKIVENAISPKVRERAALNRESLRTEFGNGMRQLGVENAADAHGLNRPLYESGVETRLPIQKSMPPSARTAPKAGTVEDGFIFTGGDPSNPKSWKLQ